MKIGDVSRHQLNNTENSLCPLFWFFGFFLSLDFNKVQILKQVKRCFSIKNDPDDPHKQAQVIYHTAR